MGAGMFRAEDLFELAIRLENNGERYYRQYLGTVADPEIKRVLSWLAEQEVQHADYFTRLKQVSTEHRSDPADAPEGMLLQDFLGKRALSLDEVQPAALTDIRQALQVALEFESDTILFFDLLRAFVTEPQALTELDAIIAEERRHIEILQHWITRNAAEAVV
jgi:rubrerythrin